jgi:hypothetical protein
MATTTSKSVFGDRFNVSGHIVETVEFNISASERHVYLHITGPKLTKSYTIPIEAWDMLVAHVNQGR